MPNWIEGTLKARGKQEDLLKFFSEGLERSYDEGTTDPVTITKYPEWTQIELNGELYVKGTRRAFVDSVGVSFYGEEKEEIAIMDVRQAWCFEVEDWVEIAKKFNIDIRLFGIECGMGFCSEIEIMRDGAVTIDRDIEYTNWRWECPFPNMGG